MKKKTRSIYVKTNDEGEVVVDRVDDDSSEPSGYDEDVTIGVVEVVFEIPLGE